MQYLHPFFLIVCHCLRLNLCSFTARRCAFFCCHVFKACREWAPNLDGPTPKYLHNSGKWKCALICIFFCKTSIKICGTFEWKLHQSRGSGGTGNEVNSIDSPVCFRLSYMGCVWIHPNKLPDFLKKVTAIKLRWVFNLFNVLQPNS